MKFKATRKEFRLEDESGYSFDVVLANEEQCGWQASITFTSSYFINEQGALDSLQRSVAEFMRMAKDVEP